MGTRLRKLDESKIYTDVLGRAHRGHRQGIEPEVGLVEKTVELEDTAIDENEAVKEREAMRGAEHEAKGVAHDNDKAAGDPTHTSSFEPHSRNDENEKSTPSDITNAASGNPNVTAPTPQYSGLILAAAGLIRLGLGDRITHNLSAKYTEVDPRTPQSQSEDPPTAHAKPQPKPILHAVGQGALGIQIRANDPRVSQLLEPLRDKKSELACLAERGLMRFLEGGCSVPIGVETSWSANEGGDENPTIREGTAESLTLHAVVVSPTPTPLSPSESTAGAVESYAHVETSLTRTVDTADQAESLGVECAKVLLENGAGEILKDIGRT